MDRLIDSWAPPYLFIWVKNPCFSRPTIKVRPFLLPRRRGYRFPFTIQDGFPSAYLKGSHTYIMKGGQGGKGSKTYTPGIETYTKGRQF